MHCPAALLNRRGSAHRIEAGASTPLPRRGCPRVGLRRCHWQPSLSGAVSTSRSDSLKAQSLPRCSRPQSLPKGWWKERKEPSGSASQAEAFAGRSYYMSLAACRENWKRGLRSEGWYYLCCMVQLFIPDVGDAPLSGETHDIDQTSLAFLPNLRPPFLTLPLPHLSMKFFTILAVQFALVACSTLSAQDIASQTIAIEEAHLKFTLPGDWIKIPDRALDRFRQGAGQIASNIRSNYVAGFAGPRPPANAPLTLLLVQIFPRDLTPQAFLASIRAAKRALVTARPDLKLEQPGPYVDAEIGAVVAPGRTQQGTSGRSYSIPTSEGIIALDLYCPTDAADKTFRTVEAALKTGSFTNGVERNKKWLEDFDSTAKQSP